MHAQIKPLPPPPGTFELIRKRARRRKVTRAAAAAAGAAAVIAVIATVPRLVITQLNVGPGPAASGAQVGQTSAAGHHHHRQQPSATAQPSPGTAAPSTAPPPAPPNFAATSVTFVGTATGYLLGQAGHPRALRPAEAVHLHVAGGHRRRRQDLAWRQCASDRRGQGAKRGKSSPVLQHQRRMGVRPAIVGHP